MLPDICLIGGDADAGAGIGQPPGVGGGIGPGIPTSPSDGLVYPGDIGGTPCNRPVIAAVTGTKRKYNIQIQHTNGTPVVLTDISRVKFLAKETSDAANFYLNKTCTITDSATGMISLSLKAVDIPYAGVWLGAFHLQDASLEVIAQYDIYLYIEKSLTSAERTNNTITIPEVRILLLDRCPADNPLLDDLEFSDSEIAFAIRRPVDEWNERPPHLMNAQYTPATFPYRYYWMEATAGELLKMASRNLLRNKLDYQAAGLSINDKSRAEVYVQLAEQIHIQYLEWMQHEKFRINAEGVYGGVRTVIYY